MNSQCRKMLRDEESSNKRRRKSPAKSGVEPSGIRKAQQQQSRFRSLREDELRGPPSRTRASLRRRHHEPSSSKQKVEKKLNQDRSRKGDKTCIIEPKEDTGTDVTLEEPLGEPSITQPLPDKQTLELIIDTLQRKDIYEIFAEPVDPEEVADYYEIIEEPMDFGTMRAKLHEGMYTSLEQFKHDVFLIPGNAMHFNSSGTIFFRQAHGIDKLAKRVFHVLRANPENFESELSGNRRRSCRRSQDETNELNRKSFLKTSEKSTTAGTGACLHNSGKRCDSIEADRRSSYRPFLNLNNGKWSKSLIHLHQQEHSYSESLMQFVKDLGPTAKMVAKRKLQNTSQNHQTATRDIAKQPQIPSNEMWFNSYHPVSNNRDESSRNGMIMSYSDRCMGPNVTSTTIPTWLQPCVSSRFALDLRFLQSNLGKMKNEETIRNSYKSFDTKDLSLRL